MFVADITIVGDNSDLNVYKTAGVDGTDAGCCGPVSANKSSCCGGKETDGGDELSRDLDLNHWAGKLLPIPRRWKDGSLLSDRLFQSICGQSIAFQDRLLRYSISMHGFNA